MLAEFVKSLTELASKAQAPSPLKSNDPRTQSLVVGGQIIDRAIVPDPRRHRPATLAEVIELANRFKAAGMAPVVWYGPGEVVLVLDDDGHRLETATFGLSWSEAFLTVKGLCDRKAWMTQKDFVRFLRIDLAGALPPGVLLDRVRKLSIGQQSQSQVLRGKESLGISATASTGGDGDLPEEVAINIPVYCNPGELRRLYSLVCSVELDPTRVTDVFRLLPLPDEIDRVVQAAVMDLGSRLTDGLDEGIPSYCGCP